MPDIVLTDGNGDTKTYYGAKALGVDTADGGIAIFYSEDVIPEGYTHPDTHPASMITGLVPVATGGAFENLWKKPFFDLPRMEETELAFTKMDDFESYVSDTLPGTWENIKGEPYKITWDGVEYTCTCKDASDQNELNISNWMYFGNLTLLFGAGLGEDTNEPFLIGFNADYKYPEDIAKASICTSDSSATHKVSIIPVNSIHKLDAKYLPDGLATEEYVQKAIAGIEVSGGGTAVSQTDILPEQTIVLESEDATSTAAPFMHIDSTGGELYQAFSNLAVGETYIVVWDGETYECTAQDVSDQIELEDGVQYTRAIAIALGNLPLFFDDAIDSGEPFVAIFGDFSATDGDGTAVTFQIAGFQTYPGIAAESVTHTVRIYQEADVQVSEPPEFDLTAMGLPALTLDGTEVSVECDTTELRTALEKNLVKLSFTANTGTEQTVSGIVNAMCMGGSYQCGFLGYLGCPTMLNFEISETAITGKVLMRTT